MTVRMRNGKVYLVGAGPGDPGLLTVRGAECLAMADLVLYDGLVNPLLLRQTKGVCERTARTRHDGSAIVPQQQINERLITEANAGKTVVRLKGGDPYIFGRGGEEAAALHAAGIPFEVIPGVTAATAAGEYAGFSFTHRDISSAVAFVTGHEDPSREVTHLDYAALAKFPGTLVFYMGLSRVHEICQQLIAAGLPDSTPAAIVCQASLTSQRVVEGTLSSIPELVSLSGLKPPSLIVVGHCVRQRAQLSWFENLPLFRCSVGITRPDGQADEVARQVVRLGGEPVLFPLIQVSPVDAASEPLIRLMLARLHEFQWLVFTSVNGVTEFFRHLQAADQDSRALHGARIAAIGTSTAEQLRQFGIRADLVPDEFRAETLAEELRLQAQGQKVLWLRANRGRDVLPKMLAAAGVTLEQLVVYENRDFKQFTDEQITGLRSGRPDWVGLSSPSIARQFARLLDVAGIDPLKVASKLASISAVTTAAAKECGLPVACEATEATWAGILDAIQQHR